MMIKGRINFAGIAVLIVAITICDGGCRRDQYSDMKPFLKKFNENYEELFESIERADGPEEMAAAFSDFAARMKGDTAEMTPRMKERFSMAIGEPSEEIEEEVLKYHKLFGRFFAVMSGGGVSFSDDPEVQKAMKELEKAMR